MKLVTLMFKYCNKSLFFGPTLDQVIDRKNFSNNTVSKCDRARFIPSVIEKCVKRAVGRELSAVQK